MPPLNQLTKGQIISINYEANTCTVDIPLLSPAGDDPVIIPASMSIPPGVYNGYQVGDAVYVLFEDGWISTPVVIGKLYLGIAEEKKNFGGAIVGNQLYINNDASIPLSTKLLVDTNDASVQSSASISQFKTIADLAKAIQKLTDMTTESTTLKGNTIFCKNPCENMYGKGPKNHGYSYINDNVINSYIITLDGKSTLTEEEVTQYMLYMTGKAILPEAETSDIYNGVFLLKDTNELCVPLYQKKEPLSSQLRLLKL